MDLEQLWTDLIRQLKSYPNVNASQIDAFFSRVQIQAASPGFVIFTSDNSFIKDWIEKHYIKDIQQALHDLYEIDFFVQIEVDPTAVPSAPVFNNNAPATNPPLNQQGGYPQAESAYRSGEQATNYPVSTAETRTPPHTLAQQTNEPTRAPFENNQFNMNPQEPMEHTQRKSPYQEYQESLRDTVPAPTPTRTPALTTPTSAPAPNTSQNEAKYNDSSTQKGTNSLTFDTFVIGDSNRMAYSMAVEVADRPGSSALNPLFIYGRSGVGKTHLLCAIKNYINEQYSDFNVCYIDSMELVNKYSDAARETTVDKQSFKNFENFFHQADVLLIDDIQGLQGKPGTLSALFRIFNSLIPKGKQFVFSADRAPKNIDLDERYVSRFNSGATIDIQPPDDETKRNIIKSFITQYKNEEGLSFTISDDILDYIVENSSSNIRELKSAITNVIFALKMDQSHELSETRMKELLGNHFIGGGKKRITIEMIQAAVEDFYNVAHKDLIGKKKERRIVHPRQVAIYLCRELSESTLKNIGNAFNRDHTTVMHSCDLINNQLQEDRNLREELEAIREKIRIQQY